MLKAKNLVKIAGRIYECKVVKKVTGENSKKPGTEFYSGELIIAVDEDGLNLIPVHFTYVTAVYSSGKKNNTFDAFEKIIDGNTWLNSDKDSAIKVTIDGSISVNDFVNNEGEMISAKRIEGSFVNIVSTLPEADLNSFKADLFINKVVRVEADPEKEIAEDYLSIGGYVFDFRNDIIPVNDLMVKNSGGIAYFESFDVDPKHPVFIKVDGKINRQVVKKKIEEEVAFGDPSVSFVERKKNEWIITSAAKQAYEFEDESKDLTPAEMIAAKQRRELHLAEVKKRNDEYLATINTVDSVTAKFEGGFVY